MSIGGSWFPPPFGSLLRPDALDFLEEDSLPENLIVRTFVPCLRPWTLRSLWFARWFGEMALSFLHVFSGFSDVFRWVFFGS